MSMVIDGEASETDDEIDQPSEYMVKSLNETQKNLKSVPLNKPLETRWKNVGTEVIQLNKKRIQYAERNIINLTEKVAMCFHSMQTVGAKLNVTHNNLTRLEDSVADLTEASKCFPRKFNSMKLRIPVLL